MEQRSIYFLPIEEQIEPFWQEIPKKNIRNLKFGTLKYEIHIGSKEEKHGFRKGKYVCICIKKTFVYLNDIKDYATKVVQKVINMFFRKMNISKNSLVMVAGFGNRDVASDSLGNLVTEGLVATENLPKEIKTELGNLCYVNCGVGGKTGIRSFDVVVGVAKRIKPDLIIMVDSLSTKDVSKVGCCFQISNVPINPGAGVNNYQKGFCEGFECKNVISIGVPLLISGKGLGQVKKDVKNMFFAPKEVDFYVKRCAEIISSAINKSVHKNGYQKYF